MITNFFIPELNNHDVQELWFQQDGAACHTARATIDLLKDTFGDRLISRFGPVNWPPRSCDLTPLDYFLWDPAVIQRFPVEAYLIRVHSSQFVISRGLDVKELAINDLWWKGPDLQNIAVATSDSLRVSSTVTDQCYTNELKPMCLK
ncbi:uncharacterized protein TNCV_3924621 [Trichonephila clavipes]|nr:uncharacterized protein TNCV_3924621 [Trichonephila clavipes]